MLRDGSHPSSSARLRMLRPLGQGSYGAVHEAIDMQSGQHVAVKELARSGGEQIARFKHEFRALSGVHHPNLVGLKELIEDGGRWLIVMELVPGSDLIEAVRGAREPASQASVLPRAPANDNAALPFDEGRLRGALVGIAEGLAALHGHGLLHRDLKPSNVRVRPDGRAVLLDFGLATSIHAGRKEARDALVGTVSYMAPEQAAGAEIGPAADLYALGVCLFEALTGQLPFGGTRAVQVLRDKQERDAPRAASIVRDLPADLDALCAQLLARDPSARPTPAEVVAACGRTSVVGPWPAARGEETPFTGRDAELELLARALARTHQGEPRVVLIEGESGIGKSELVRAFLRRTRATHPGLVALRGRCYENEQVSYKAFDGCIDELASYLKRLTPEARVRLLPVRAALLGQLFPVLRELREIDKAPREGISADPTARRLEAFGALGALLGRIAEEHRLVLVIDDLQWADAESFRLLTALVQESLAPPLLLVATMRPRESLEPPLRAQVERVAALRQTSVIELFGLPHAEARTLAGELLETRVPEAWLTIIAEESQGNPLFIGELVQFARRNDLGSRGSLSLEAALSARIVALDARARALLEAVALAARPHGIKVFASALGKGGIDEPLRRLLAEKLLILRKGQQLACYHDRIRQTVTGLLEPARRVVLHGELAIALSATPGADAAEQARHWELAGEPGCALEAYTAASAHALDQLAFARAAELCGRALVLLGETSLPRVQGLTVRRAYALACAGMSADAAELYREAADRAHGDERIRLRSHVAQQLMLSAKVAEGVRAATAVLRELGVSVPVGLVRTLLRYAYDWLLLRLRGTQGSAPVDPARRLAVEVLSDLLHPISIVYPLAYVVLPLELLRLARGLPQHVALGLTMRCWSHVARGKLSRALPLLADSRRIVATADAPVAAATQAYLEGAVRLGGYDYQGAAELLLSAHARLAELCPDRPWLVTNSRYHLLLAWYHVGRHDLLASTVAGWLAETRERNDALGTALLAGMGHGFVHLLMRDQPDEAQAELEAALARVPVEPFSYPHWGELMAMPMVLCYRAGPGSPSALAWLDAYEAKHRDAFLMKTRMCREMRLWLRGLALLRAAEGQRADAREAGMRAVRQLGDRLERSRSPYARAMGALLDAQALALARQHAHALARARTARARFADLQHHAQRFAAYLEGLLEQSPGGRARCAQTRAWLSEQGWRNPSRALTLYLPLLGLLEPIYARRGSEESDSTRLFERYEVLSSPAGAAAASLTARDVHTGRLLTLQQLEPQRGTALEHFKQVFRALSDLRHPNIVAVEALFEHAGRWYMALEHVDGPDLLGHVRPDGRCHPARLYATFEGLARALAALHEAGFVHRDVRPDHVRVAPAGRAVLCDFALMAQRDARGELLPGSVDYAAPEQLAGAPPAPSADVYALGCCLYRALHGTAPFAADSPAEMLERKRARAPSLPSALDEPQLAAASALALRAMAPHPEARPALSELLAVFAQRSELTGARGDPVQAPRLGEEPGFTGRELELAALGACFEETCDAGFTIALVSGESGVGKSALVSTFAARTREGYPLLLSLRGRCYQSEQIALKAFDGVVDQLAALLRSLPNPTCESLLPRGAALLAQLFPVLTSVPAIAHAQRKGLPADPGARRIAARASFVELLERLSAVYELLLVIDDVQWADGESFALLRALSSRAAALPFLCLCTARPDAELPAEVQRELTQLRHLPNTEVFVLEGLSDAAAGALARALYGAGLTESRLEALVRESKGHPLFLRELIEHEKSGRALSASALTLDGALRARIASFDDITRALLGLVALGERPHPAHVYALALERSELPRASLDLLLRHNLLRHHGEGALSCFHDRIRQATLDSLADEARRALSRALAHALTTTPGDASAECARLWDAGGDPERATTAYELAGDRALAALAFDQATQLYARALALVAVPDARDERVRRLLVGRGHALVRAGHSAAAADVFQQAADGAEGEEQVRLRLWCAQHRILGGELAAGLDAAAALLSELGLSLPQGDRAAQARIALERVRVRMGRRPLARVREVSQRERLRLDALHGLAMPVRDVWFLPGSALVAQYLRRALAAGEPVHTARALANEALWREVSAPSDREDPLFAQAAALATGAGEPGAMAEVGIARGLACLARNQFRRAPEHLARAHELIKERCPGEPWLLTAARMYLGAAWFYGGDLAAIAGQTGAWVSEARSRDDRYALAALTGFGAASLRHLLTADADEGLEELADACGAWPDEPFTSIHFGAFTAQGYLLSSKGPGDALRAFLREREPWLRRAFLMRTPTCREAYLVQRMRAELLALDSPRSAECRARLAEVRRLLRALDSHRAIGARALQCAYGGMVHAVEGRSREALAAFDQARAAMGTGGWWVILGLDYVSGLLTGGEAGRALCDGVLGRLREEGWRDPRRGLALRVPVLHLLE